MTDTTFASLFSGCGCLDLGLERAGMRCIYQCEWDRHARAVLRYRFPGTPLAGDITLVKGDDIPQADVWAFGSPCKEFARCNVRNRDQGIEGGQSRLAWEVARLLSERQEFDRPGFLLWENVGSVFDSPFAEGVDEWLGELAKLGYWDIQAHLLRGIDVGIPQLRDRWFTLMAGRELRPAETSWELVHKSAFELLTDVDGPWMPDHQRVAILGRLRRRYAQGKTEKVLAKYTPLLELSGNEPAMFTGNLSWSPTNGVSPTLDCTGAHWVYLPGRGIRALTAVERERLMGLPDGWTALGDYEPWPGHSDKLKRLGGQSMVPKGQRIKMTGNGVIVQAAELMGKQMLANIKVTSEAVS